MARVLFKDASKNKQREIRSSRASDNIQGASNLIPPTVKELAVHEKKLAEIAAQIDPSSRTRALIVSGPAGSGKSTALRASANQRGLKILEFLPPDTLVKTTSMMESFREFLLGASVLDRNEVLILVEELPNVFHEDTRLQFESALLEWVSEPGLPIIAISFTEIEINARYSEALVVSRILGHLIQDPFCVQIKINPPSATSIKKSIKQICLRNNFKIPEAVIKELGQCGDIRNASICLEMMARSEVFVPYVCTRDTPTELFHAVGKVIWTTKKENSLENALTRFGDTMEVFNLTILENYTSAKYQRLPIDAAAKVTEWLSSVDLAPSMSSLGASGVAYDIAAAHDDNTLPKKFVATKLTQFPKWRHEAFESESKIKIKIKNRRLFSNYTHTPRSMVLDELGFASQSKRPVQDIDDDDENDDLDVDDFDLDTFG